MKSTEANSAKGGYQKSKAKPGKSNGDDSEGLRSLLVDELKDIYWAEKALVKALPKMVSNASSDELAEAITSHLEETKQHVTRLEEVFAVFNETPQTKKCEAMSGLIEEAEELIEDMEEGVVRDAGLILAAQKVEHYEIATYGTLVAFANTLGEDEASSLLQETLAEEKEADVKLTEIAESSINVEAASEDAENMDDEANGNGVTATASKSKKK
jgi:ferritin-like metal-binding protein YciE